MPEDQETTLSDFRRVAITLIATMVTITKNGVSAFDLTTGIGCGLAYIVDKAAEGDINKAKNFLSVILKSALSSLETLSEESQTEQETENLEE